MEQWYRAHAPAVARLIHGLTRDRDLTEDLVQETFVRATRAIGGYRGGEPRAWLLRIARTTTLDHLRRCTELPLGDELPPQAVTDPDVAERLAVRAALARLSEDHRTVLVLRDDLGLPHDEVAAVLDRSVGAARVLLHRARAAFTDAYRKEGGRVR